MNSQGREPLELYRLLGACLRATMPTYQGLAPLAINEGRFAAGKRRAVSELRTAAPVLAESAPPGRV